MDEFDRKLEKIFCTPINKPYSYKRCINKALYKESEKRNNFFESKISKVVLATFGFTIIITSTVFAKDVYEMAKKLFASLSIGVENAISHHYIENVETDYIESNGISLKVNNVLMDDCNLDLMFECKIKGIIDGNVNGIAIDDVSIIDEDNQPIWYLNNNYEYEFQNKYIGNIKDIKTDSYATAIEKIDNSKCQFSYTLFSNKGFPKSKKLYIKISRILLNMENNNRIIEGAWNFEINLPQKFYNRSNITYKISDETKDIQLQKAILQPTGLNIRFQITIDEYLDSERIKYLFKNLRIEDEKGNIYQVNSDSGIFMDQWLNLEATFSINIYNTPNELKLIIPISEEKELNINLIKN